MPYKSLSLSTPIPLPLSLSPAQAYLHRYTNPSTPRLQHVAYQCTPAISPKDPRGDPQSYNYYDRSRPSASQHRGRQGGAGLHAPHGTGVSGWWAESGWQRPPLATSLRKDLAVYGFSFFFLDSPCPLSPHPWWRVTEGTQLAHTYITSHHITSHIHTPTSQHTAAHCTQPTAYSTPHRHSIVLTHTHTHSGGEWTGQWGRASVCA